MPEVFEQLDKLDGADYIQAYVSILPYAYAKLQSISMGDGDGQNKGIRIIIEDVGGKDDTNQKD
jgi:hypothetical protein